MIESAVRAILIGDSAVNAIIQGRAWFQIRPQGERRGGVVLSRTGGSDPGNLDGSSAGFIQGTMQVYCLAPTYPEAKQLSVKVIAAIDGFSGTVGTTECDFVSVDDASDIPIVPPEGKSSPSTFGVSLDVSFMCHEVAGS